MTHRRLVSIGECMVELTQAPLGDNLLRQGFAGDTLNMAYYARKCLPDTWQVDYVTALGTDRLSDAMVDFMAGEGIGTSGIRRVPNMLPGLYMVHVGERGERSFSYWRSASAARLLAADRDHLQGALAKAGAIHFSGITLAILEKDHRETLFRALQEARADGAILSFDSNIRPALWTDRDDLKACMLRAFGIADVLLPSFDDEAALFGDRNPGETLSRYEQAGTGTVVLKDGAGGVSILSDGRRSHVPIEPHANPLDTTGAGDSFDGAFLARYLTGSEPLKAAAFAAGIARRVIGYRGALMPMNGNGADIPSDVSEG